MARSTKAAAPPFRARKGTTAMAQSVVRPAKSTSERIGDLCARCGDLLRVVSIAHYETRCSTLPYVFLDVPAKACSGCGELWLADSTLDAIEGFIKAGRYYPPAEMNVWRFAQATESREGLCARCGQKRRAGSVTHQETREGDTHLFLNVPAQICSTCGESWIDQGTLQRIEGLLERGEACTGTVILEGKATLVPYSDVKNFAVGI